MHGGFSRFAEAREPAGGPGDFCEKLGEALLQRGGEGAMNFQAKIAPTARNAVAVVFLADIESAHDGPFTVDHEELAVIAPSVAFGSPERVEPAQFAAELDQAIPKMRRQPHRAERIQQNLHAHPAQPGRHERFAKAFSQRAGGEDIHFKLDRVRSFSDPRQHRLQPLRPRGQPPKSRPVGQAGARVLFLKIGFRHCYRGAPWGLLKRNGSARHIGLSFL